MLQRSATLGLEEIGRGRELRPVPAALSGMKHPSVLVVIAPLVMLGALGACGRRDSLYADRSIPTVAPPTSAGTAPRFVGRWAASTEQCREPWVIEARRLRARGSDCDFDKVDSNSAGYTVTAICHSNGAMTPVRMTIAAPDKAQISMLTISGGPFRDAVPLQRCIAE